MRQILQTTGDTSSNLKSENPLLAKGEGVLETDTGHYTVGDGTTRYNDFQRSLQLKSSSINILGSEIKSDGQKNIVSAQRGYILLLFVTGIQSVNPGADWTAGTESPSITIGSTDLSAVLTADDLIQFSPSSENAVVRNQTAIHVSWSGFGSSTVEANDQITFTAYYLLQSA